MKIKITLEMNVNVDPALVKARQHGDAIAQALVALGNCAGIESPRGDIKDDHGVVGSWEISEDAGSSSGAPNTAPPQRPSNASG